MNHSSEKDQPGRRGLYKRIAGVFVCLIIGLVAALVLRHREQDEISRLVPPRIVLSPEQILASIPRSDTESTSGKAVSDAIEKAKQSLTNPTAWVKLGDSLSQQLRDTGDQTIYDFAEKAYLRAIDLKGDSVEAMNGMAWVTGGRHVFDQSKEWARKALAIEPNSADAHGILGDASVELGDYDEAFGHYQKMMDLRPDLSSWSRGAYLLWLTGSKAKATSLMEQAIRSGAPFAENTAWCRAKLATMLMHDGAFTAAAQALEPSLREHSRNSHILLASARLAVAMKDHDIAEQYYKKLMDNGPNHDALVGLGDLKAIANKPDEAEIYYKRVDELHAAHLVSGVHDHMQMAKFLADHDRNPIEALRLAKQHKLTRNVLEADILAWVYFKNNDQPRAIEAIKRALSQKTPDGEIHYHAGMIAAKFGDTSSAKRHLQLAISLNPQFNPLQAPIAQKTLERVSGQAGLKTGSEGSVEGEVK